MAAAQNSRVQRAFIAETTFGTTPVTPQTQLIEVVNLDIELQAEQLSDPSIRSDRQTAFSRRGNLSASGNLEVVLCPDNFDPFLEAVMGNTFSSNVLKNGNVIKSFAIEEGFPDLDTPQYRVFNGVMVNSMSMNLTTGELANATFNLLGTGATLFTGTSIDATPTAIVSKDKFYHDGGEITEAGSPAQYITSVSFEMTNNLQGTYALGSTSYRSISLGKIGITGTVTALFESPALYNKYRNSTDSSLSFQLVAGAESLKFEFPKVKYTSGSLQRGAEGPVLVELGFEAIYDTTAASSLVITRV